MNRRFRIFALAAALVSAASLGLAAKAQDKKTTPQEEFFIVASVDRPKSQLLLKHPTEVTTLLNVEKDTSLVDDNGKPLQLSDLRTGDTVWVVTSGTGPDARILRLRKGSMTVLDLHRYYLDYPVIE